MEPEITQAALEGTAPAHDLSIIGLILHADIIVQAVLLLLLLASLWSWAIIFDKIGRYRKVSAEADTFEDEFWSGRSLEELYDRLQGRASHPMALLFQVAMREWQRSIGKSNVATSGARLQERIAQVMRLTLNREVERLERYLGFLATVGSTAPFVGLFGTVWGIMNSFQAIGASADTSLAVVAPGIAEALFATAVGLVAAIPAVIAYNKFAADMDRFANRLEGFVDEFNTILSRQIDEGQG
ncbi:protein TolQ [Emcibacter sp. SYSU 3D8]|uniref:protein TolQ n=1 Tax=Emcibacter sp. SYSU 3D8 TaxID=3133969 RepID=UPI0031FEDE31